MNKLPFYIAVVLVFIGCFYLNKHLHAGEKVYVDEVDIEMSGSDIYIHEGGNIWTQVYAIYGDDSGIYYTHVKIARNYEKKWKCPYCHMMWPLKQRCQNPDCPSRYSVK